MKSRDLSLSLAAFLFAFAPRLLLADETNLILTVDGVIYTNVTWGTVTPATVAIFHRTGIAVVPIDKLPVEWQEHFDYNPEKAATYRAAELKMREQAAKRLDRDATARAIDAAVKPRITDVFMPMSLEDEVQRDDVEAVRWRYKQLLELQKTGHPDYRAAIDLLVEACRRAIDYHYELKKERPEFREAGEKSKNFRPSGNVVADNAMRQQLLTRKVAADAYYKRRAELLEEAKRAWNEGQRQKSLADDKGHPPPPPKPAVTDPYLQEAP